MKGSFTITLPDGIELTLAADFAIYRASENIDGAEEIEPLEAWRLAAVVNGGSEPTHARLELEGLGVLYDGTGPGFGRWADAQFPVLTELAFGRYEIDGKPVEPEEVNAYGGYEARAMRVGDERRIVVEDRECTLRRVA